jgi:hypothetical protein
LPALMELYEAHQDHRDQFEILAFHDATAKTFTELDQKMEAPKKNFWHGKDLPFPILLDATGETLKTYEIRFFPTTILIDPEGKLVGEAGEAELEKKLPPLSAAARQARLSRVLDKYVGISFNDPALAPAIQMLAEQAQIDIRIDAASLQKAGIATDTKVPFQMQGMVSLRSALNLLLAAHNLTFEKDEKGLVVIAGKFSPRSTPALSEPQRTCAERIEKMLDGKRSFDFRQKSLTEIAQFFEQATTENFVLDPAARRAGLLDSKMKVSGAATDLPLRQGLQQLLDPVGLAFVVRDEVVVLTPKPKR